jgi:hypothetical protein
LTSIIRHALTDRSARAHTPETATKQQALTTSWGDLEIKRLLFILLFLLYFEPRLKGDGSLDLPVIWLCRAIDATGRTLIHSPADRFEASDH